MCGMLCESSPLVSLPTVTLKGHEAVGLAVSYYEVKQVLVGDDRYVDTIYHWTVGGSAVILCTNALVTSCLVRRLL